MNYWTLDIPEPQVIIEYEEDEDGFYWHHRVLLKRISGPKWVALTPDQDLETVDLSEMHHIVLERNADFPRAQRPFVYCFDEFPRSTLDAHKRRAGTQAALLGLQVDVEMEQMIWVVSELDRDDFGDTVDDNLLTGGELNVKGVVLIAGEEVFIERIEAKNKKDWMMKRRGDSADLRLLGDHYDKAGKRKLDLSEAVALFKESVMDDFPLAGVRGFKELHDAIANAGISWTQYHSEWVTLSGVAEGSAVCHTHRVLAEVFRLMHSWDQLDGSNLASGEQLARWMIQTETAVERNPRHPDFSGLDIVIGAPVSREGKAETRKFSEWITNRMEQRSKVWKHERLFREEQKHLGLAPSTGGGGGYEKEGNFKKKTKGKDKGKGKGKENSGGGEAAAETA